MIRYLQFVVGPSACWAVFVSSAFVGIGGMSIMGAGASDAEINCLWKLAAVLTLVVFVIALALRMRRLQHWDGT